jgi:hypothetical protein
MTVAHKEPKPRWRQPLWLGLFLVSVVAFASIVIVGAATLIRYANPLADVTSSYYEKTVNCTSAKIGDVVQVNVTVYWHGYIFPEFKRNMKIIDPYPENRFRLADENETNVFHSHGYGGSYQLEYSLRAIADDAATIELPEPTLYLGNVKIPLSHATQP